MATETPTEAAEPEAVMTRRLLLEKIGELPSELVAAFLNAALRWWSSDIVTDPSKLAVSASGAMAFVPV